MLTETRPQSTGESILVTPLLVVISGRNTFQQYFMVFMLLGSIPPITGRTGPGSVMSVLPPWVVSLWGGVMAISCVIVLSGTYWKGYPEKGITVEATGAFMFGVTNLVFPFCLLVFQGKNFFPSGAWYTFLILIAFSAASFGRIFQLRKARTEVRLLRKEIELRQ